MLAPIATACPSRLAVMRRPCGREELASTRFSRSCRTPSSTGGRPPDLSDPPMQPLSYRPPFDWSGLLAFLRGRAVKGVEWVGEDDYHRTVRLGGHAGWIHVRHAPERRALLVELTHSLTPALPALLGRLQHLFDLSARSDVIAAHLMR